VANIYQRQKQQPLNARLFTAQLSAATFLDAWHYTPTTAAAAGCSGSGQY